ncbi:hypothetical protein [Agrobacterium sp. NPDC090273]|uniref:hypothetical protein n=1 Tax=Agrobacterium sp. NPDC090273 TaxID=3363919 RepID=UPI00383B23C7
MSRKLWQLITYYRHRSELWTLRLSRSPTIAIRPPPIFLLTLLWYAAASLPLVLAYFVLLGLGAGETAAVLIMSLPAVVFLFKVAPWFFRWFWIGVSLQFGSFKAADAKEEELSKQLEAFKARRS